MEVYVLESYDTDSNLSEILNVFENLEVGMNAINILNKGYKWETYHNFSVAESYDIDNCNIVYYLHKLEVILDEIPNNKLLKE